MGKVSNALSKAAESEAMEMNEKKTGQSGKAAGSGKKRKGPDVPEQWDERFRFGLNNMPEVAENIRTLRTRILYPVMGKTPRSILVTSASPGEGKSFICANLALSLSQGVDSYCLVVDCDLRRPAQHTLFGISNVKGLSDYLQNKEVLEDLIVKGGVPKLSVLPCGPVPANPSELSGSSNMVALIEELESRYDDRLIVLDSPPLNAAAETAILAQQVDGVVLVVRHGQSRREHIRALVETIGRDKVIGVVFNAYKMNLLDSRVFGYYADYQSKYYYSKD